MFRTSMTIAGFDPELAEALAGERRRQEEHVELIASENYASPRVLEAQGSVLTNKYAEGYPGKRYYGGCEFVDVAESIAIDRAKRLFGCAFANVQPHSGAQANQAVLLALLKPGDTVLGMSLAAGGAYPSPLPHAHIVTTTTHKTLRGPRGGMILSNDEELGKKINSAVFPGLQGGPLMHVIAAKAVAFGEALQPSFRDYAAAVVANARALADTLVRGGLAIVSGGTDSHLMLVDLRPKRQTGRDAEFALERAGITCNKNGIPFDPEKPTVTSGIRLGSPAATTRGFGAAEFRQVGAWIGEVLHSLSNKPGGDSATEQRVRRAVEGLCARFPIYPAMDRRMRPR